MHQSLTQQRSSDMSLPDSMGKSGLPASGRRRPGVSTLPLDRERSGRSGSQGREAGRGEGGSARPLIGVVDPESPRGAARRGVRRGLRPPSLRRSIPYRSAGVRVFVCVCRQTCSRR